MKKVLMVFRGAVVLSGGKKGSRLTEVNNPDNEILIGHKPLILGSIYEVEDFEDGKIRIGKRTDEEIDDDTRKKISAENFQAMQRLGELRDERKAKKDADKFDQMTIKEVRELAAESWQFKRAIKYYISNL